MVVKGERGEVENGIVLRALARALGEGWEVEQRQVGERLEGVLVGPEVSLVVAPGGPGDRGRVEVALDIAPDLWPYVGWERERPCLYLAYYLSPAQMAETIVRRLLPQALAFGREVRTQQAAASFRRRGWLGQGVR